MPSNRETAEPKETCQCPRCGRSHRKMTFTRPDSINVEKILVQALEYAAATIEEQMTFSIVGGAIQAVAKEARDALSRYTALTDPTTSDAVRNSMAKFICGIDERRDRDADRRGFERAREMAAKMAREKAQACFELAALCKEGSEDRALHEGEVSAFREMNDAILALTYAPPEE